MKSSNPFSRRFLIAIASCASVVCLFSSCVYVQGDPSYSGPKARPAELSDYYSVGDSYQNFTELFSKDSSEYRLRRLEIGTDFGQITVDYFQRHTKTQEKTDELILVFPILGGKYLIESHFADYFARRGFDVAIVHRDKEYKRPEQFSQLE